MERKGQRGGWACDCAIGSAAKGRQNICAYIHIYTYVHGYNKATPFRCKR